MPEGPEVKLLVGQLNKLEGKKITFADIKEGPTSLQKKLGHALNIEIKESYSFERMLTNTINLYTN